MECYHCAVASWRNLQDYVEARNRQEGLATTGVQSQCTYRRGQPYGRFVADVQGFRRGGEVDRYEGDDFGRQIETALLRRQNN